MSEINISKLPRILVIDDQLGRKENSNYRDDFCTANGLLDITEKDIDILNDEDIKSYNYVKPSKKPVAKVYFFSGQKIHNNNYVNDLEEIKQAIDIGWGKYPRWCLILLDLKFNQETFGLTVLENLSKIVRFKDLPIILMSEIARENFDEKSFSYMGVRGFISKDKLNNYKQIQKLLFEYGLLEDNETVDQNFLVQEHIELLKEYNYNYIIGHSIELLKCLRDARNRSKIKYKKGGENILVVGETGTGKELIASYIHKMSGREGKLQTVFTEGVSESLIEGEIFGWEKGAFTGALYPKEGAAELAKDGTLFIDEFGDVSLSVQSKLLRLLDKNIRESKRLGSEKPVSPSPNIQVVLATNRFEVLASHKGFRTDLLARINAYDPIILPSLNERREDIYDLSIFFLRKFEKLLSAQERQLTEDAINKLIHNDWKRENIRGLERVLFTAINKYKDLKFLTANHLELSNDFDLNRNDETFFSNVRTDSIEYLLNQMRSFNFDAVNPLDFKAIIPKLEESRAMILGNLFKAAFNFMLSFDRRDDTILPIGATAQMLFGDNSMSSTKAAREIEKIYTISETAQAEIMKDKLLYLLYHICSSNISNKIKDNEKDATKLSFIKNDKFLQEALELYTGGL